MAGRQAGQPIGGQAGRLAGNQAVKASQHQATSWPYQLRYPESMLQFKPQFDFVRHSILNARTSQAPAYPAARSSVRPCLGLSLRRSVGRSVSRLAKDNFASRTAGQTPAAAVYGFEIYKHCSFRPCVRSQLATKLTPADFAVLWFEFSGVFPVLDRCFCFSAFGAPIASNSANWIHSDREFLLVGQLQLCRMCLPSKSRR